MSANEAKWDVLVVEDATNKVEAIMGKARGETGFLSVDNCIDKAWGRIDCERYSVIAVPTGSIRVGDRVAKSSVYYVETVCRPTWSDRCITCWSTSHSFNHWILPGNGGALTRYYATWIDTLWHLNFDRDQIATITGCRRLR